MIRKENQINKQEKKQWRLTRPTIYDSKFGVCRVVFRDVFNITKHTGQKCVRIVSLGGCGTSVDSRRLYGVLVPSAMCQNWPYASWNTLRYSNKERNASVHQYGIRFIVSSGCRRALIKADQTQGSDKMSGETEIEVSVVSEEDLELEGSRSSSAPAELLLQDKNNCSLSNSCTINGGKAPLRPACTPQYTSFSISSILGRSESPIAVAASSPAPRDQPALQGLRVSPPPQTLQQAASTSPNESSQILGVPRLSGLTSGGSAHTVNGNSSSFAAGEGNPLMGHATADLAMLSR